MKTETVIEYRVEFRRHPEDRWRDWSSAYHDLSPQSVAESCAYARARYEGDFRVAERTVTCSEWRVVRHPAWNDIPPPPPAPPAGGPSTSATEGREGKSRR